MRVAVALFAGASAYAQCGLMSWEEYGLRRHTLPYVLRLTAGTGELLLYGVRHTRDPRDAQVAEIERLWREFRPEVAFSEGGVWPLSTGRDEAVSRYGEPGLLRFLAERDRVELKTMEPPASEEAAALARRFGIADVKLFYYLRYVEAPGDDRDDAARRAAALQLTRRRGLTGAPDTVEGLEALAERRLPGYRTGQPVREEWVIPTRSETALNAVARASSDFRNCHMVRLFLDEGRAGRRAFVLVGGSHVIMQEAALRRALAAR